jgi:hypothetical protein
VRYLSFFFSIAENAVIFLCYAKKRAAINFPLLRKKKSGHFLCYAKKRAAIYFPLLRKEKSGHYAKKRAAIYFPLLRKEKSIDPELLRKTR